MFSTGFHYLIIEDRRQANADGFLQFNPKNTFKLCLGISLLLLCFGWSKLDLVAFYSVSLPSYRLEREDMPMPGTCPSMPKKRGQHPASSSVVFSFTANTKTAPRSDEKGSYEQFKYCTIKPHLVGQNCHFCCSVNNFLLKNV